MTAETLAPPLSPVEQSLLTTWRQLPLEKQTEILDFAEFLRQHSSVVSPFLSSEGLCADLGVHITEDDIAEARREMWGNFPAGDIGI